jgi:hypothetical protein
LVEAQTAVDSPPAPTTSATDFFNTVDARLGCTVGDGELDPP